MLTGAVSKPRQKFVRQHQPSPAALEQASALGSRNGTGFKDPACADNKSLPLHRWVPWIAGFSAPFVDQVLDSYLGQAAKSDRPLVLDPFAGVGTTLLQAALRGFDYAGFDLNPYAVLAARVKLRAARMNPAALERYIAGLRRAAARWRTAPARSALAPVHFRSRVPFFSPTVERQVLHALRFIRSLPNRDIADLFRVAFGAVMVSFSNYTYEPSLGSRPGAGKPLIADADVAETLLAKLHQMHADVLWLREKSAGARALGHGEVHHEDFLTGHTRLPAGSVDLVVTSPPYLNNYHYVRNTRPQLYWLSLVHGAAQQRELEARNFGKFWQTVRGAAPLSLTFRHAGLRRFLSKLRGVRSSAGPYGGPGWANYAVAYFNDCDRFLGALSRLLRADGVAVIVIGNSIIQGLEIRTEQILGDLARQHGLAVEGIHCIRDKRVGASITQSGVRRGKTSRSVLAEYSVVLRKR
jgi:SAM-dependent methyltransferase